MKIVFGAFDGPLVVEGTDERDCREQAWEIWKHQDIARALTEKLPLASVERAYSEEAHRKFLGEA